MAAPTLQAQGTINAVTGDVLSLTVPTYAANDIIVVTVFAFQPNGANPVRPFVNIPQGEFNGFKNTADADNGGYGTYVIQSTVNYFSAFWARATSASSVGTSIEVQKFGDTGNDTCFAGRIYVIRGCDPNGEPFDSPVPDWSTPSTAANPQLPAETVLGTERLIIHFMAKTDNTTNPTAATGYTVGTNAATTTGTDGSFQTYRRTADANVTAVTPTGGAAPAANNGTSAYFSVVFRPNNPYRIVVT